MRLGFTQDQIKIVVNGYQKKPSANLATLEQIQQTLNQPVFYGVPSSPAALAAVNRGRPFVADRQAAGDLDRAFRAFVDKATGAKHQPSEAGGNGVRPSGIKHGKSRTFPDNTSGADRWFEIKSRIHAELLNSLTPEQLKSLSKDGVRDQIGNVVERLITDDQIPMTRPSASASSKRCSTKSSAWVRSNRCSKIPPSATSW